jgi:plastocyanin
MAVQDRPVEAPSANKAKRRIAGLDWLILAGLVASFAGYLVSVLTFVAILLSTGNLAPPFIPTSIALVGLAIAIAVLLTGWRWSFIVMLVVTALDVSGLANPYIPYTLAHPWTNLTAFVTFATIFVSSAFILVALVTKLIRKRQGRPNVVSGPMIGFTGAMAGVLVGALLLGFMAQGSGGTGAVTLTPKNEYVYVQGAAFMPDIVALHTGDTLTITDVDGIHHIFHHIFANGTWNSGQPAPGAEPGAVPVSNLNIDNGSVKVGPFTTLGTYHIYCTVHPGMSLTIIVQ